MRRGPSGTRAALGTATTSCCITVTRRTGEHAGLPALAREARAIGIAAGKRATRVFTGEWPAFAIVEIDQPLVEHATSLVLEHDLRSLDALHLAAALLFPREDMVLATWDRRLHTAAGRAGLELLPGSLG